MRSAVKQWPRLVVLAWLLPAITILFPFFLLPVVILVRSSFNRDDPFELMIPAFSSENYVKALTDSFYVETFTNTLGVSIATALGVTLIAYPVAYFMARYAQKSIALVVWIVYMPLFTSAVVRGFGWMVILADSGMLNSLLLKAGIISKPIKLLFEVEGMLVGMVHRYLPLAVLPLYNSLRKIPSELYAASHNLGATPARMIKDVVVPLSLPGAIISFQLVFAAALSDFVMPQLLGTTRFRMLAPAIFEEATTRSSLALASALSVLMLLAVCLCILLSNLMVRAAMPWARAS
jgi:ABC-type spermidine/putrescine transport system permease subunit I